MSQTTDIDTAEHKIRVSVMSFRKRKFKRIFHQLQSRQDFLPFPVGSVHVFVFRCLRFFFLFSFLLASFLLSVFRLLFLLSVFSAYFFVIRFSAPFFVICFFCFLFWYPPVLLIFCFPFFLLPFLFSVSCDPVFVLHQQSEKPSDPRRGIFPDFITRMRLLLRTKWSGCHHRNGDMRKKRRFYRRIVENESTINDSGSGIYLYGYSVKYPIRASERCSAGSGQCPIRITADILIELYSDRYTDIPMAGNSVSGSGASGVF